MAPGALAQTLVLQNLVSLPRDEWCSVVVPFAEGKYKQAPPLHAEGHATVWQPFGARWPDGSLRQAICLVRAQLPSLGELRLPLQPGPGPALPTTEFLPPVCEVTFEVTMQGKQTRVQPLLLEALEHNAARKVLLLRARLPGGLVAELIVTGYRDQLHAFADVAVFYSDPTSTDMQVQIDELAVRTRGMALLLYHAGQLAVDQQPDQEGSRCVLLRNAALGDGQGLRRTGVLLPPRRGTPSLIEQTAQAASRVPLLGACGWRESGAFFAFGYVPPPPPWLAGDRLTAALAAKSRAFLQDNPRNTNPFAAPPLGMAAQAGQTGDQNDFGTVKLSCVAWSGIPSYLFEVEASVLQESLRPVHCFEADGSPVLSKNHPQWVVWAGRTHWHPDVSTDRLGKPAPEPRYENHGWTGKDRQHWSTNYLGAYTLLTGAHWARRELQNDVQLYLAGQTIRPGLSTSGGGAARGAGRTLQSACWMYLATGDQDLLRRMNARIDQIYLPGWFGRELQPTQERPYGIDGPDARLLEGKSKFWNPWQDAIAAVGFAAAYSITRNDNAKTMAEELAMNVVRFGFKLTDKECIIATAIRWADGVPLTKEEIEQSDPTKVLWGYGTAFNEWSIGAVVIASAAAAARGDAELQQRAEAILRRIRAGKQPPRDGFYDRLTEWDAVRWPLM